MIVCFGSINLDLIFALPTLPLPGQTVLGPSMKIEPGGKGANQAVAAARDGASVLFAGAVGQDSLADQALATMRAAGVDLTRVVVADTATGCASICVDPHGANHIAVASGANMAARQAQVETALLGPGTTVLLQAETDLDETAALIRRAKAGGARVVLNLAPAAALAEDALRSVDVLVVNEDEGRSVGEHFGVPGTAAALHAALGMDVVLTLGGDGLSAATRDGSWRLPVHEVTVVDTTGAGDCFTGVLAAGLDRGLPIADAIRRASVAASLAVSRPGSQGSMPTRAETDAALAGG